MSIRDKVFTMLDEGKDLADIVEQLKLNPNTAVGYKQQWKHERGIKSNPAKSADELADKIVGDPYKKNEAQTNETFAPIDSKAERKLKLESESKRYKGKYGTYVITDGVIDIVNVNATEVSKVTLSDIVSELNELGGLI